MSDKSFPVGDGSSGVKRMEEMGDGSFAEVGAGVALTYDSTYANAFNVDSLPKAMAYNADGTLLSITAGPDHNGFSYKQTLAYSSGRVATFSAWVKQ